MIQDCRDSLVCALLVGEDRESRLLIHEVFREVGWRLYEAQDRKQALHCLEQRTVHVVIVNDHCGWPWRRVLDDLQHLPNVPQVVVTSSQADEALWAEVLNRGGYDVLAEPLQREEVERVIASARRHFEPQGAGAPFVRAAAVS